MYNIYYLSLCICMCVYFIFSFVLWFWRREGEGGEEGNAHGWCSHKGAFLRMSHIYIYISIQNTHTCVRL